MITVTYSIDKALYDTVGHQISLETTEYIYGNEMIVHQRIGRNLGIRLNNRIQFAFQIDTVLENDLYFYKKTYHEGTAKPVTRSTFEEKQKRFDMSQTAVEQEILEDCIYIGADGRRGEIQIVITIKNTEMTAEIDFESEQQYRNFVSPVWLIDAGTVS